MQLCLQLRITSTIGLVRPHLLILKEQSNICWKGLILKEQSDICWKDHYHLSAPLLFIYFVVLQNEEERFDVCIVKFIL